MADKIDQIKFGSTSWDIDLPYDAQPTIYTITVRLYEQDIEEISQPVSATYYCNGIIATDSANYTYVYAFPAESGVLGLRIPITDLRS